MLTKEGFATWNIEYSRLGSGGEWPSSFLSVGAATDYLREISQDYPIDIENVVTIGYLSGGHYALWLAARSKISPSSELGSADSLRIKCVVSLVGTPDIRAFSKLSRGERVIPALLGNVDPTAPTRRTVQRWLDAMDAREVAKVREGAKTARQKFVPVTGENKANQPLEIVQIDHTPADIILVDSFDRQPIGRPWVTLEIDIATRMVTGTKQAHHQKQTPEAAILADGRFVPAALPRLAVVEAPQGQCVAECRSGDDRHWPPRQRVCRGVVEFLV